MKAILLGLVLVLTAFAAGGVRLPYGHDVRLSGTIRRQTFPGPPNYEDISLGDAPETYWIIELGAPVDVIGIDGDSLAVTERDIRSVQLVFGVSSKQSYSDYDGLVGKRVVVAGELFHGHTGHHKTEILISVRRMQEEPNQSPQPTR